MERALNNWPWVIPATGAAAAAVEVADAAAASSPCRSVLAPNMVVCNGRLSKIQL